MVKGMRLSLLVAAAAGTADLKSQLQQVLDQIVSSQLSKFPDLVMSFAWKDASQEVAVASGTVLHRPASADDTFLYGSGTKPVTAASLMHLIDKGVVNADDKAYIHLDPYLKKIGKPSMQEYFGEEIKNATVLSLIRMSAGIRDFEDDFTFDKEVLGNGSKFWNEYPYDAMSFSVSDANIKAGGGQGPLICPAGGNCTSYSSTSYDVAGLVLAAVVEPQKAWHEFDLGSVLFADRSKVPSMQFPNRGNTSAVLTVPGNSLDKSFSPDPVTIYDQDASILGFTCGNMVARPTDVARFFYWLLDAEGDKEQHLISRESAAEMTRTTVLTKGWAAHYLSYGAGIQDRVYGSRNNGGLAIKGHEGATYAFLSASGYAPELEGSFSLTSNNDRVYPAQVVCPLLEVVKRAITGNASASLGCRSFDADKILV